MSHSIKFPNKLLTAEPQVLDPAVQAIVRENLGIPEGGGSGPGGITQFVPKWTIYQKSDDLKVECAAAMAHDITHGSMSVTPNNGDILFMLIGQDVRWLVNTHGTAPSLTHLYIPSSVTGGIINNVFAYSLTLEYLFMEDGIPHIGAYCFHGCPIKSLEIPKTITLLDQSAFMYCNALTSLTFRANGTQPLVISSYAFDSTSYIGEIVPIIYGDTNLTSDISIARENLFLGERCFGHRAGISSFNTTATTLEIEANVFYGCMALTNIEFRYATAGTVRNNAFDGLGNGLYSYTEPVDIYCNLPASAFEPAAFNNAENITLHVPNVGWEMYPTDETVALFGGIVTIMKDL